MTLNIAEHAGATDVGRQRESNEDALFVAPPLFAVADGMGGAKAGEVASHIATAAFEAREESGDPPELQLAHIAREANRRIYELAASDESVRGMGTTLTAAMLTGRDVSIGHVGDSRAYRMRDGQLEQLTKDHSLVAELERSGQISPEAAEHHPQRSIITRALGPEPDVEVDTYTVPGRPDDVFLLCSDGLTSMVSDDELGTILRQATTLEDSADNLVRAANQSGGKDNITVVLFRLGEDGSADDDEDPADGDTIAGQVTADEVRAAAEAPTATEPEAQRAPAEPQAAVADPPPATAATPPERHRGPRPRPIPAPRHRRRLAPALLRGFLALLLVGAAGTGLWALSRQVWFVGTDDAGLVTLYRGVPYELPFGVDLYTREYQSSVPARSIPATRRRRILDHDWRSRDDATDLVQQLERGRLEASR